MESPLLLTLQFAGCVVAFSFIIGAVAYALSCIEPMEIQ